MRAKLQQWVYAIRGSYWFVPGLMAVAAIVLSQVTVQFDRNSTAEWMSDFWWATLNQPEGARALLAAVAGSMITVAGVTFSLTILAVSYATSHFGPRLLDNFMHDRGNQVTLGTFVATFLYCLLVLRSVRAESGGDWPTTMFVPQASVLVAIALTLASVGVLIYFIHHVPESINVANVLERISQQVETKIKEIYPENIGESATDDDSAPPAVAGALRVVHCHRSGYLQGIDEAELMTFTTDKDAVVRILVAPGDYLLTGQPIAEVIQPNAEGETSQDCQIEDCQHLVHSFAIGTARTPTQDIYFLLNQFVEVAARALSPGVNDPFTAIQCIDQLGRAMINFSSRSLPSRYRKDDDGNIRVITTQPSWETVVERSWGRLMPYAKDDANVQAHLQDMLERVLQISENQGLNQALKKL